MFLLDKAQNVIITPETQEISVGDEVTCTANGNPLPNLILRLGSDNVEMPQVEEMELLSKFVVPQAWQGEEVNTKI